jgi:hypothetical protein
MFIEWNAYVAPDPERHSRQAKRCKYLIMSINIFKTPFLLETGFCLFTFTISNNFLFISRDVTLIFVVPAFKYSIINLIINKIYQLFQSN